MRTPLAALAAFAQLGLTPINAMAETSRFEPQTIEHVLRDGDVEEGACTFDTEDDLQSAWELAVTASAEARSEGLVGMALTIEIMVSRMCVDRPGYGGETSRGVVTHPWAFSVFNDDSHVRDHLYELMKTPMSGDGEIAQWARKAMPIAIAALNGWRTGMLPNAEHDCRHYLTRTAKASWENAVPDLVYRNHEFHCRVDS